MFHPSFASEHDAAGEYSLLTHGIRSGTLSLDPRPDLSQKV
jgi:hypothetical protein